ncbi:hypothetical protein GCM10023089_02330 [Quisquiliibacterium transsilvanicum]|uniref:Glucan phosphoethanolaminetransferase (Alkaline phosphatase superfamily) n=1 Tax=Quisquiliibacterium transsilvanicum TaxID=1549638 RepID=A0A7W8HHR2_9BURK|nr:glucan phosphoethanolaminetransferase (alkaline phosphatase superfamily) [Quisquiliibacterium transsilvanicum]
MHLALWLACLGALIVLLNAKINLDAPWKEYAALLVLAVLVVGLLLTFPVLHWGESSDENCRWEHDKAGPHLVCE